MVGKTGQGAVGWGGEGGGRVGRVKSVLTVSVPIHLLRDLNRTQQVRVTLPTSLFMSSKIVQKEKKKQLYV